MCDPVSASVALVVGGSVMQGMAGQKVASAQQRTVAEGGRQFDKYLDTSNTDYQAERGRQNASFDRNQATVGSTLDGYSMPNQQKLIDEAGAKREAAYVSPISEMAFTPPVPGANQKNYAVLNRNEQTGRDAKTMMISEALAKAKLDGYGDARVASSAAGADNAQNILINTQAGTRSRQAADVKQRALDTGADLRQGVVKTRLEADKGKGHVFGSLGDLFTSAGMMAGMAGAGSLGGVGKGMILPNGTNSAGFLARGTTPNIGGTGLLY